MRAGLWLTLALFAVVVVMVLYLIWFREDVDDDLYWRALGIVGILAALGAVVVPVLSLLLRDPLGPRNMRRPHRMRPGFARTPRRACARRHPAAASRSTNSRPRRRPARAARTRAVGPESARGPSPEGRNR